MTNYGQDSNFPIMNHLYSPIPYGNWPCYPYFYYPTQINHIFYSEQSKLDESLNACAEVKKE